MRFLFYLKEIELIEPLVPTIYQCLQHSSAYVRRNAILACMHLYQVSTSLGSEVPEKLVNQLENVPEFFFRKLIQIAFVVYYMQLLRSIQIYYIIISTLF